MASETRQDPERIYLEPAPYSPEGRLWCEDDVWPLDGDGPGGVEYVRADLHDAEIARLTAELEEAKEREKEYRHVLILLTSDEEAGIASTEYGEHCVYCFRESALHEDDCPVKAGRRALAAGLE